MRTNFYMYRLKILAHPLISFFTGCPTNKELFWCGLILFNLNVNNKVICLVVNIVPINFMFNFWGVKINCSRISRIMLPVDRVVMIYVPGR